MAWEQHRKGPPEGFPALPPIPPGRYTSQEFFDLEMKHLWGKVWLYAGHQTQVPEPGSYLLLDIPWAPVFIIRGKDGKIRAFYNVCSHRGAPLVRETSGKNSLLRCTYHQWTYDTSGELISVMDERDFPEPFDKFCLGLQELRCEMWGPWIFISENPEAPPLRDWLGMIADEFEQFEIDTLRPAEIKTYELECNWKLTMDAFLEVYHIKGIHPKTVGESLDHTGAVMGLLPNGHTRMTCPTNAPPEDQRKLRGYGDENVVSMPEVAAGEIARNYHVSHNIFPNVITPVGETARQFLMFWPLSLTRTRVDVVHFGRDWGEGSRPAGWDPLLAFWDIVMDEDLQFLEWQQKAVLSPGFKGYRLSYMERRIYYAHESIDRMIGAENIPEDLRVEPMLDAYRERPSDHAADPLTMPITAAE
ncbi:MAG: aromatic ring-hydroxylating dioxygenase subunit alpha [Alphaproteobacteria bacterium]|nr:aromatic ring-hydroxylating dioxygenase subunit alpha [Alphaproteobacteria bacterium]